MMRFQALMTALFNNFTAKVFSVLIAIVLWVVVLGSRSIEGEKAVPLQLKLPDELVLSQEVPAYVSFRLSGPKAVLRGLLDRAEDPIVVDLTKEKAGDVTFRFFSDNIRVPIGVRVLSVSPSLVTVRLEPHRTKEVPVRVEYRGSLPEGLRLTRTEVKPATYKVKGPQSRVQSLREVVTLPIDLSGLRQNFIEKVPLEALRDGLEIEGDSPLVALSVEPVSANFRIKNVPIRFTTEYKVRLSERAVSVFVRAGAESIKSLDQTRVFAAIDLKGRPPGTYEIPVQVTLPKDVSLFRVVPEQVTVTLY
jgi:YbbR domain-containing protein